MECFSNNKKYCYLSYHVSTKMRDKILFLKIYSVL
ncbi:MAG: hypothetical protein ACI8RD_006487 [Bacillariaceae sp.]|jgi:hypothetical protein